MADEIYVLNNNDFFMKGLHTRDGAGTKTYVNNATLTLTLYDLIGGPIDGATAVTLSYEATSNGNYRGTVASSAELTAGHNVRARMNGTLLDGTRVTFEKIMKVKLRGAT